MVEIGVMIEAGKGRSVLVSGGSRNGAGSNRRATIGSRSGAAGGAAMSDGARSALFRIAASRAICGGGSGLSEACAGAGDRRGTATRVKRWLKPGMALLVVSDDVPVSPKRRNTLPNSGAADGAG